MRGDGCLQAELALAKTEARDLCDLHLGLKDHVLASDPHVDTSLTNILGDVSCRQKHNCHWQVSTRSNVKTRSPVETQTNPLKQLNREREKKKKIYM